jgi:2,4-dienoyl-CoA reductase-like NADH-dependent reductase (Old Yellow Enzyme family)/thioredoxin reductase
MTNGISRRHFLTGAGLAVAGASFGNLGLSEAFAVSDTSSGSSSRSVDTASSVSEGARTYVSTREDTTYGSILNPQEDFSAYTTDYSSVFSPLKIANVTLKNRLAKSCAGSEMQKTNEWPDETSLAYYSKFCEGGIGMICFEPSGIWRVPAGTDTSTLPDAMLGMGQLDISSDAGIPAHKVIADRMHSYGTPVIAQMLDMGMVTGGSSTLAEGTKLEPAMGTGLMQTTAQLQAEQQDFINTAERYYKAGFDGVELNASCNHYFSTYLSRSANSQRTDQYSGETIENRARILTEIIEGIRQRVGKDFIVQVLYSGIEGRVDVLGKEELCTTVDEACEMAKLFEKAGASSLHIRSELYGHHCAGFMPDVLHYCEHGDTGYASVVDYQKHFGGSILGQYQGYAGLLDVAARIKSCVGIPIGVVGAMDPRATPDLIDHAIRDGKIDFVLMTRPLMAGMDMPNKLKNDRRDEAAPCVRCMTCFVAPFDSGKPMYCRVNPALTNAFSADMPEGYDPPAAAGDMQVMVIGAGPAGMEAAHIAAQRGYHVTLYEKSGDVGGLMNLAMAVKGTHERIIDHKNWLRRQLEVQGATLVLNKEVDINLIQEEAPDAIVIALGGAYQALPFPAVGNVVSIQDFYEGVESINGLEGDEIVIYGGQLQACDLAEHFSKIGKKITILNPESEDNVFLNAPTWPRLMGREWLHAKGVKIYNDVVVSNGSFGSVTFDTGYGTTVTLPYDVLINGLPLTENRDLYNALENVTFPIEGSSETKQPELYAVGDCYSPSTIAHATQRANIQARKIGSGNSTADAPLTENQHRGKAVGFGDVSVTLTVAGGTLTAATVNTSNETVGYGRSLGDRFAQEIMSKGSIDTVSGATVTSNAVSQALVLAKQAAGI